MVAAEAGGGGGRRQRGPILVGGATARACVPSVRERVAHTHNRLSSEFLPTLRTAEICTAESCERTHESVGGDQWEAVRVASCWRSMLRQLGYRGTCIVQVGRKLWVSSCVGVIPPLMASILEYHVIPIEVVVHNE